MDEHASEECKQANGDTGSTDELAELLEEVRTKKHILERYMAAVKCRDEDIARARNRLAQVADGSSRRLPLIDFNRAPLVSEKPMQLNGRARQLLKPSSTSKTMENAIPDNNGEVINDVVALRERKEFLLSEIKKERYARTSWIPVETGHLNRVEKTQNVYQMRVASLVTAIWATKEKTAPWISTNAKKGRTIAKMGLPVSTSMDLTTDGITDNLNICAGFNCTTKAGNGECDHECNSLVCGYDGGDCSVDGHNFLPDCPFAGFCMRVFKDGHCDPKCNVKECHFDGYDCDKNVPKCSHSYAEFCINSYGDGTCQRMCNNRGCGWDGGDCLKTPTTLAQFGSNWVQNHLAIAIRTSPWDLYLRMNRLRMFLSSRLKAVVTVVVDEFDRPLIYEWSPEELAHKQITWNQKSLANYANDAYGVLVKFSLDVTVCFEEHIDWKECVNSIQQAVNILDTLSIREQFRDSGFDVKDISAVKDRRMGECDWRITENCWRAFGDGMCDKECNTVGCGFDGGDCLREAEKDEKYVLPGYLTVIALSNDINVDISRILMRLSKQLRAVVSVAIRNNAQPLIYRWSSSNFSGELIDLDREKRASNTTLNPFQQEQKGLVNQGYLIKLKVDTSVCHQWGWTKCIPDVYSAAAKLNKFVKKNLQLYLIYASELDLESTSSNLTVIHYIALCSIIFSTSVTVIFITYVVITVRRNRLYRNSFQNISLHFKASEPDIVTIQEPGEERNHLVSLASRCDDA
ncbi:hypothetical protein QR680_000221 [Steinernema hermaphroditum]|uniref:LNR domain-containing protein n=1 Tax=Steinernema hermaphroditum TaxID=289476 RepID=A0AA39GTW2_9BILA|nr:hypothetical protein QR680_000221 [Steinernema hermaphroditum]